MVKIFSFSDESGTDSADSPYIVASVLLHNNVAELERLLLKLEAETGSSNQSWNDLPIKKRLAFIRAIAKLENLKRSLFYSIHLVNTGYQNATAFSIANALGTYANNHSLPAAKCVVTIDGLNSTEARRMATIIRKSGIRLNKIRGAKDQSNVFIRLADRICGLARDAYEGNQKCEQLLSKLVKAGISFKL